MGYPPDVKAIGCDGVGDERSLSKRIQIIGSTLRGLDVARKASIVSSFLDEFGKALSRGKLRPIIDSVYPMEQIEEAHQRLSSGKAFGKVVLRIP